jgi:peptide deformylase
MALREILICGDPVLRRKAQRVAEVNDEIRALLDDLAETMMEAPGLGLAAPQIGESVRCIVVRDQADSEDEKIYQLVNPRVRARAGEAFMYEGCLSLPTLQGEVRRPHRVVVTALGREGEEVRLEAEGLLARVLMHEIDHLDGVLFSDRSEPGSLGWMVPDENEEGGYRLEATNQDEINAAYARLLKRREQQKQAERKEQKES